MTNKTKNVSKLHIMLERLKQRYPRQRIRAILKSQTLKAKGWGFNVQQTTDSLVVEPIDEAADERP